MTPEPNAVVGGRYTLNRRIAVGGMGEVWEATDTLLDRPVAVKILKDEFRTAPTFLARFRAEARHAGQLSHPGIATVYDYGETPDLAFLVMELVRGQPLSEVIAEQPALPATTKLSILAQAAQALHAAHEAGVVHRDVKPSNLMIRNDGTVKVTDFGIARARTSAALTDHGQMIGTPAYVSPEQAAGGQVTAASDIYSLGVVAYELFGGSPPFERDTPQALTHAHVNDLPPPLPNTAPRGVVELIESALSKDPSQRPPSAAAFARQLRREMMALQTAPTRVLDAGLGRGPTPTVVLPATASPVAGPTAPLLSAGALRRGFRSRAPVMVAGVVGLLVLIGATFWATARPTAGDNSRFEVSAASTIGAPPTQTPLATEPPTTQPPPTEPPATEPPTTQPPTTQAPTTQAPTTQPPATQPPSTQPPSSPAPPAGATAVGAQVAEDEALAFVVDYYERIGAGDFATTWESLSPEFRDARNLTFERYVSYWENTTLEIRELRFVPGPGVEQSRVRFQAHYDTGSNVVDETDEITLRRNPDGRIVITEQRVV